MVYLTKPLHSLKPRAFSFICFVHLLSSPHAKLSARSLKCIILGYSRTKKGIVVTILLFNDYLLLWMLPFSRISLIILPLLLLIYPLVLLVTSLTLLIILLPIINPPIVYTRRSHVPYPSLVNQPPTTRYADPPLVFTRREKTAPPLHPQLSQSPSAPLGTNLVSSPSHVHMQGRG